MFQQISHTPKASVSIPQGIGSKPLVVGVNLFTMEKICGIYKITSPTKRIYIGQSKDVFLRWKEYKILHYAEKNVLRKISSYIPTQKQNRNV